MKTVYLMASVISILLPLTAHASVEVGQNPILIVRITEGDALDLTELMKAEGDKKFLSKDGMMYLRTVTLNCIDASQGGPHRYDTTCFIKK